ncbi:hypothetical protein CPT_Merlin121 [Citrobacter phage Merlin]|jgi:hypothetical protein|uniref:Uncharacterized protein n=1 Tax=Citrobacter phage Merlin TaxID=1675602 RepID=A0A0K1LMK9_9CAUD|nr:hypothetical protein CPT_Merlin121 [Citrobacter phage Merlin]AKU43767.1 hypothetical protein CPT_Merlin121 [Citrobacter phage Merlin]
MVMMSKEERERIIDDIDELIRLAKHAGVMAELGTDDEYAMAASALCKQRYNVLSKDGIE